MNISFQTHVIRHATSVSEISIFSSAPKATKGNKAIAHPQRVAMGEGRAARAFVRVGVGVPHVHMHVGGLAMQHDGYDALPEHIAKAWHGLA